mmetsp:Transcript_35030/g.59478  ORF Transcript_35030/g.59478 Transcript_35030/m.59478 type:complete len:146 (-) Transcript_35030:365-802(-)
MEEQSASICRQRGLRPSALPLATMIPFREFFFCPSLEDWEPPHASFTRVNTRPSLKMTDSKQAYKMCAGVVSRVKPEIQALAPPRNPVLRSPLRNGIIATPPPLDEEGGGIIVTPPLLGGGVGMPVADVEAQCSRYISDTLARQA